MSSPRKSAGRQPRKPPRLSHDLDRPEAEAEEVFDVQSISSDEDDSPHSMPSRDKAAEAPSSRAPRVKPSPSAKSTARQSPLSHDIVEISADESLSHAENGQDDMEMSDFEDVDVAAPGNSRRVPGRQR